MEIECYQVFLLETHQFRSPAINRKLFHNTDPGRFMGLISCQQENDFMHYVVSDTDEDIAEPVSGERISHGHTSWRNAGMTLLSLFLQGLRSLWQPSAWSWVRDPTEAPQGQGVTSRLWRRNTQNFLCACPDVGWEGKGDGHGWELSPIQQKNMHTLYYTLWRNTFGGKSAPSGKSSDKKACFPSGQCSLTECAVSIKRQELFLRDKEFYSYMVCKPGDSFQCEMKVHSSSEELGQSCKGKSHTKLTFKGVRS